PSYFGAAKAGRALHQDDQLRSGGRAWPGISPFFKGTQRSLDLFSRRDLMGSARPTGKNPGVQSQVPEGDAFSQASSSPAKALTAKYTRHWSESSSRAVRRE